MKKLNLKQIDFKQINIRQLLRNKWVWFTALSFLSMILALCFMSAFRHAGDDLRSQHAAEEWAGTGESEFAQVSVFLSDGNAIDQNTIRTFRDAVKTACLDIMPGETKNLYCDAWSTKGSTTVKGPNGSSDASVIAVGGNFFQIHPQDLISGGYFSDDDLMHDRVMLDVELAWKLFGGYDLTGMTVTIGEKTFQVAGVIARETDKDTATAYTDGAGLYMSYDTYQTLNESACINCYEIVMPNPVENFAVQLVTEKFAPETKPVIVENSSRFTAGNIFEELRNMSQRTLRTNTIYYPYWENAARLVENRCMVYMVLAILFWICPVVFVIILVVKLYRKTKHKVHDTYLDLKDQYENRVLFDNLKGKLKGLKHGRSDTEASEENL